MFDSEEEFDSIIAKGPNEVVGKFMKELPTDLRDGAAPLSNFTKVGFLARGSFGRVYHVTAPDETPMALKKLSLQQSNNHCHEIVLKDSLREVKMLASLKHHNIAKLHQIVVGISDVFLAIEFCPVQLANVVKYKAPERIVKSLTWQLMTGLSYIHSRGLIHRDIKTDNLMLKAGVLKIADFGSTAGVKQAKWTPQVVTLWYRPPEILLGCARQTCAVDVWSAGCVISELLKGKPLFPGQSEINQINHIVDLLGTPTENDWPDLNSLSVMTCMALNERERQFEDEFARITSDAGVKLLSGMLVYDPAKRLSSSDSLHQTYFTEQPSMATENEVAQYCEQLKRVQKQRVLYDDSDDNSENSNQDDNGRRLGCGRVKKKLKL
ncbi:cyclin-dependent kinase 10-like [Varroa jacobsoni]|nr:cyclin-dependent kinase 10-like isoform X2 [Varroa destructor]XP_022690338.1 cyclin-dependent kinase 10-like [Varroa jacobsoni]